MRGQQLCRRPIAKIAWHRFEDHFFGAPLVLGKRRRAQLFQLLVEYFQLYLFQTRHENAFVLRLVHRLAVIPQLLEQFFAGTQSRNRYGNVLFGHQSVDAYKVARQIVNIHGLAHIEHEHLAAGGKRARLHHKAHRFGYGHKIPLYVAVG